jgi:hypothetical protein
MSVGLRSSHGCWTCRIRKKKCDETKPACGTCKSLSLLCHGYGPKPEWLDGGAKERDMVVKIQHSVKQETSRKRRLRIERREVFKENGRGHNSHPQNGDSEIHSNSGEALNKPANTISASNRRNIVPETAIDEEEESLLMHYLDYVFPLQFRFYQPLPSTGGRGWLLSILLRTKPLYYAAITLSAYHRQSVTCQRDTRIKCTLGDLLNRHIQAIKELRLFLEGFGPNSLPNTLPELVEIIACMALLVSLEVRLFHVRKCLSKLRQSFNRFFVAVLKIGKSTCMRLFP